MLSIRSDLCPLLCVFFFFKQKTAYEMRISDWSSDVCSSDLFVSFVLALLACWIAGAPGFAATVDRIDVERDRILIHFDGGVSLASSFVLDGPRRIAVDIDGATPGGAEIGRAHV